MSLLAQSQYVVQATTVFIFICIALYYCLTGRGSRAGDVAWLLEGLFSTFVQKFIPKIGIFLQEHK